VEEYEAAVILLAHLLGEQIPEFVEDGETPEEQFPVPPNPA